MSSHLSNLQFLVLSDVKLDLRDTIIGLQKIFDHCIETKMIPTVIILCGNFSSVDFTLKNQETVRQYEG